MNDALVRHGRIPQGFDLTALSIPGTCQPTRFPTWRMKKPAADMRRALSLRLTRRIKPSFLSEESAYVTAQTLAVDSGLSGM